MSNPTIHFLINPIAGKGKNRRLPELIDRVFKNSKFGYKVLLTEHRGHLTTLTKQAVSSGAQAVVVAGGDGTVHEAAQALVNTKTILGILPSGSGNGFANHFKIPHDPEKALKLILAKHSTTIDTINVNGTTCIATAGMGFDANVAEGFAKLKTRGFTSYISLTLKKILSFKRHEYTIRHDGGTIVRRAFILNVANTSEYGNHAIIAPLANPLDGKLDVTILNPRSFLDFPVVARRLFNGTLHLASCVESLKSTHVEISSVQSQPFHIDGEPMDPSKTLTLKVVPRSLTLFTPKS